MHSPDLIPIFQPHTPPQRQRQEELRGRIEEWDEAKQRGNPGGGMSQC